MTLEQEIQNKSSQVSTNSYSMSVNELVSMYRDGELNIHPEFQRFYRWTVGQKSRFIESLLLGIPIPPIFVSERLDSHWDVIDGLQRLSTILELMGELKNEDGVTQEELCLIETRYLPSLKDRTWSANQGGQKLLPDSAKIKIKRARLDVNIVKQDSDEIAKYEIFQRLNTGGSLATDQEVRSCILIMNNREFFLWLQGLCDFTPFKDCLILTDRAIEEAFDLELITRFVVLATCPTSQLNGINELGTFLTDKIVEIANDDNFKKNEVEEVFKKTFDYLSKQFGENSFRKYNHKKETYMGGSLVSLFEIVAVALARVLLNGGEFPNDSEFEKAHRDLSQNETLKEFTKSGVRSSTRIPKTINFGQSMLEQCVKSEQ